MAGRLGLAVQNSRMADAFGIQLEGEWTQLRGEGRVKGVKGNEQYGEGWLGCMYRRGRAGCGVVM